MIVYPGKYEGIVAIPASKSDSQRAILAAGLAAGHSELYNVGQSADELSMLNNIERLGAKITRPEGAVHVTGIQEFPTKLALNVGESGLGVRLLSSLLLTQKGKFEIVGEGTLMSRPLSFFKENFEGKVPKIEDHLGFLPLEIEGPFLGGELTVSGKQSSQYISGLLMALPLAEKDSVLQVEKLNSKPYVQMTLETLRAFGIEILHTDLKEFIIRGKQKYLSTSYKIESDWSSASYWLVASALGHKISVEGLSQSSFQADRAILKAFTAANCTVEKRENRLFVRGTERKAFAFDATDCPDLFPTLAAFAALTLGRSTLFGLSRLVDKESNRALTIQTEFEKLGIKIILDETHNAMHIEGKTSIHGGRVFSNHDHRIAMSLAILGLSADNPVQIDFPEAVKKSYPGFWEDLERLKS
ncbi:MAG: 3-phosphoshikimate 1-carboxyvinyltransferase [Crocinitomicaceae bacterium]